jgi:hypothetical protein
MHKKGRSVSARIFEREMASLEGMKWTIPKKEGLRGF